MKEKILRFKEKHETLYQFIFFALMGCFTTVVDLGAYAIFNFLVFKKYANTPFSWWLVKYSPESGGLCAFLSFALSYVISQTFNFFLQRKTTFKATNNVLKSGIMYAIMAVSMWFLQIYLPSLIGAPIYLALGVAFGGVVVKCINMFTSMCIQFPINKWVIMRNNEKKDS